jgi:hypothetical protein
MVRQYGRNMLQRTQFSQSTEWVIKTTSVFPSELVWVWFWITHPCGRSIAYLWGYCIFPFKPYKHFEGMLIPLMEISRCPNDWPRIVAKTLQLEMRHFATFLLTSSDSRWGRCQVVFFPAQTAIRIGPIIVDATISVPPPRHLMMAT